MDNSPIAGKRLVFLLGAPRSGTTWLQLLLSTADDIVTANETHLFSSYMKSLFDAWEQFQSNSRNIGMHQIVEEAAYLALVHQFAAGALAHILKRKPTAKVILEKTPDHAMSWDRILRIFPDAYFLHVVRDPRAVVASLRAAKSNWADSWVPSRLPDQCALWSRHVKQGQEIAGHTRHYMEVRYENLRTAGQKTLQEVFLWMGVERTLKQCDEALELYSITRLRQDPSAEAPWDLRQEPTDFYRRGEISGWMNDLSSTAILLVEAKTKDLMLRLGYKPNLKVGSLAKCSSLALLAFDWGRAALRWRVEKVNKTVAP